MESVPEFLVTKCPEEGLEVQRGKMGCPGSHSMLAAITTQGYSRLEKPHQSTSDKTRNEECQFIPCLLHLGWIILCWGARGCPVHCRMLGSIPGLHSLEASSNLPPPPVWQSEMTPDIAKCPLGGGGGSKRPSNWWPLVLPPELNRLSLPFLGLICFVLLKSLNFRAEKFFG